MNTDLEHLEARVKLLERRARLWNGVAIAALATLAGCAALSASFAGPKVLRGNALELTDMEGNVIVFAGEMVSSNPRVGTGRTIALVVGAEGTASASIFARGGATEDGRTWSHAEMDLEADGSDEMSWSIARLSASGDQGRLLLDSYQAHSLEMEATGNSASIAMGKYDFDLPEHDDEDTTNDLCPLILLKAGGETPVVRLRDKTGSKEISTQ